MAIEIILRSETKTVISGLHSEVVGFGLEETEEAVLDLVTKLELETHARSVVVSEAEKEAARVLRHMKDRFSRLFNCDYIVMPRVWTVDEDIESLNKTACSSALKLLSVLAVVRLDDGEPRNIIEKRLSRVLADRKVATVSMEKEDEHHALGSSSTTWDEFPPSRTLIRPSKCKSLWNKFLAETEYHVKKAYSAQAAARRRLEGDVKGDRKPCSNCGHCSP
ncbi:OLC1v1036975C1 [Oldenlandia corymbosa var. corymbosa]|uniref:OLC1v1036975C1 n=1 Tax=Oldenlandia corymbosa var. corymbosa TaxID=529605 RepID=A0AAV1CY06_OLDCO|nr:OLC1v1036975C1 [Oldenlandia corymbosa var. corymbosa]